jgi:hypothetical protein
LVAIRVRIACFAGEDMFCIVEAKALIFTVVPFLRVFQNLSRYDLSYIGRGFANYHVSLA